MPTTRTQHPGAARSARGRRNTATTAVLVVILPLAGLLAACTGQPTTILMDDFESGSVAQLQAVGGGAGGTVNLSATEYKFNPSDPTVKSGDVSFVEKNDGSVTHSLEIENVNGQDKELEGSVQPGQTGTLKVNLPPGKHEFYCPIDNHKDMGMKGEITVTQ